jgi:hypothetical protein
MADIINGWSIDVNEGEGINKEYVEFAGVQMYNSDEFKDWVNNIFIDKRTYSDQLLLEKILEDSKQILGDNKAKELLIQSLLFGRRTYMLAYNTKK